tara:strand:+ start:190 stop:438 length:249 start_codon:yes stop_codon:yes gene_type:complete
MKYELDELVVKSRPDWSAEDFVVEKISCEEWYKYIEEYPNLSWGTHINNHDDDGIIVCRFVSKVKCLQYCTSPTLIDEGVGL